MLHARSNASGPARNKWRLGLSRKSRQSGIAAVEFALVMLFILSPLIVGMFELARGLMVKQILNDAARKACRQGVLPGKTNTDILREVTDIINDNFNDGGTMAANTTTIVQVGPMAPSAVGVTVDASTARAGLDFVSVKVSLPVSKVYWVGTIFLTATQVESEMVLMLRQG